MLNVSNSLLVCSMPVGLGEQMNVYVWIGPTKHAQLVSLAAAFNYTGMFPLPFFSLYRLPHKQWCELLLTCNGIECGETINVRRTKTNG